MKKLNLYLIAMSFVILSAVEGSHSTTILAATKIATPSATITPTATPSATPTDSQDLKERFKTIVKETLDATESSLKEKINLQTLVGYVGTVKSINSGNITLDSKEGTLIQITTNDKTVYSKSGAASKLSAVAISDKIIVVGTLIKDDIILAKKVSVVDLDTSPITSSTIVAKISSIDTKKKTISLSVDDKEVVFGLTKKSTVKLNELKAGETIIAITKKYEGKDLLSRAKVI